MLAGAPETNGHRQEMITPAFCVFGDRDYLRAGRIILGNGGIEAVKIEKGINQGFLSVLAPAFVISAG
jgi:hypothetical protein